MKTVLVDIGNVLAYCRPERVAAQVAEMFGCERQAVFAALFDRVRKRKLDRGTVSLEEYGCSVAAALGKELHKQWQFKQAWLSMFDPNPLRPEARAFRAILRILECPTALASNTDPWHWEILRRVPLITSLGTPCLSFELGAVKPEPEFYKRAAVELGVRPEDCLLVDDLAKNCEGARKVGMSALRYPQSEDVFYDWCVFTLAPAVRG
ncbi:MAG: HAD family phosphatase [Patescibacteria group bacterium]